MWRIRGQDTYFVYNSFLNNLIFEACFCIFHLLIISICLIRSLQPFQNQFILSLYKRAIQNYNFNHWLLQGYTFRSFFSLHFITLLMSPPRTNNLLKQLNARLLIQTQQSSHLSAELLLLQCILNMELLPKAV